MILSEVRHMKESINYTQKMLYKSVDLSQYNDYNVLVVHQMGFAMFFNVEKGNDTVVCLSLGNGHRVVRSKQEVVNMISKYCICWCEF